MKTFWSGGLVALDMLLKLPRWRILLLPLHAVLNAAGKQPAEKRSAGSYGPASTPFRGSS